MSRVRSGLQLQVLALYRDCLRATTRFSNKTVVVDGHAQPGAASREFVRDEFRRLASSIDRKDVNRIEYMIRRTKRQLELLSQPSVDGISVFRATV